MASVEAQTSGLAELERLLEEARGLSAKQVQVLEQCDAVMRRIGGPTQTRAITESAKNAEQAQSGGERRNRMPQRRATFENMKLAEAARILLDDGSAKHVDDLVEEIFDVTTKGEAKAAKSSLAAAMHAGVAYGDFRKVRPNTFAKA